MNLSIWPILLDFAKKFKHFLKLNHDVPKKVNDERFVDKTGKASWKTKHKPKAGNDSPMYASDSDPVFKKW